MKIWYRIERDTHGFWLAAEDREELDKLLEKKGYTDIVSIKEDPNFPACLSKPADRARERADALLKKIPRKKS